MIVSSIYSQGTAEQIQDVCLTNPPVLGVVDCHDGINKTGQNVRKIILSALNAHYLGAPQLKHILEKINNEILRRQLKFSVGSRAGAVFALATIGDDLVSIVQGGDSLTVWQLRSGEIGFTPNKYAVLNGDPKVQNHWFTTEVPKEELDTMLFFTDGLVTGLPVYGNPKILPGGLIKMSNTDGLEALVNWVRGHQKETLKDAHIQYPEISIVSVRF